MPRSAVRVSIPDGQPQAFSLYLHGATTVAVYPFQFQTDSPRHLAVGLHRYYTAYTASFNSRRTAPGI